MEKLLKMRVELIMFHYNSIFFLSFYLSLFSGKFDFLTTMVLSLNAKKLLESLPLEGLSESFIVALFTFFVTVKEESTIFN